jgi:hypothetical protein
MFSSLASRIERRTLHSGKFIVKIQLQRPDHCQRHALAFFRIGPAFSPAVFDSRFFAIPENIFRDLAVFFIVLDPGSDMGKRGIVVIGLRRCMLAPNQDDYQNCGC